MHNQNRLAAHLLIDHPSLPKYRQLKSLAGLAHVETQNHRARLEPVIRRRHARRRRPTSRQSLPDHFVHFRDALCIARQSLKNRRIRMQPVPLVPIRQKKRIKLEALAFITNAEAHVPNDRVRAYALWEGWFGYDRKKYIAMLREAFEPFVLCLPKTAEENLLTDSFTEEELKRFPLFAALTITRS